jgi:WG containing repeat
LLRKNHPALFLFLLLIGSAEGGILPGPGAKAHKKFEKGKLNMAKSLSYKAIKKDSLSPLGYYGLSRCLIYTPVPREIDSAHWAETIARTLVKRLNPRDSLKVFKKTGGNFDPNDLRNKIDDLAFYIATSLGQVGSYQHFIGLYPQAPQLEKAIFFRDSIAYEIALNEGSSSALNAFLEKYPESKQANDAAKISELFLFKEKTRDGSWQSFRQFYLDHPASNFVREAHYKVFQLKTFRDNPATYSNFIDSFPENLFLGIADTLAQFKSQTDPDFANRNKRGIPVWHKFQGLNARFDSTLILIIPDKEGTHLSLISSDSALSGFPVFDSIPGTQLFSKIESPWTIKSANGSFSLGHILESPTLRDLMDIHWRSPQWAQTKSKNGESVRHFMGFGFFKREFEKIQFVHPNLFFGKRHGSWNAFAPNGHQYNQRPFDTLFSWGNLVLGLRDSLWMQFKSDEILKTGLFSDPHVYDYLDWSQGFLLTRSKQKKYLLDPKTGSLVESTGSDQITNCRDGWLIENSGRFSLLGEKWELKTSSTFREYKPLNFGFAWKPSKSWVVSSSDSILGIFDSVATYGSRFNQYWLGDSLYIHSEKCLTWIKPSSKFIYLFPPGINRDFFILEDLEDTKEMKTPCGEPLFSGKFDEIKALSPALFRIKKNGLYGLVDTSGKNLIRPRYDFIFNPERNVVLLFRNKKYEAYLLDSSSLLSKKFNSRPGISEKGILFSETKKALEWLSPKSGKSGSIPNVFFENQINDSLVVLSFPAMASNSGSDSMGVYDLQNESFIHSGASEYLQMGKDYQAFYKNGYLGLIDLKNGKIILKEIYDEIIPFIKKGRRFFFSIRIMNKENIARFQVWDSRGDLLNSSFSKIGDWYDQYY